VTVEDVIELVNDLTQKVTAIAWALFLLTWSIGWTLRGAPVPFSKLKRAGTGLVEDSVWAAFWLARHPSMPTSPFPYPSPASLQPRASPRSRVSHTPTAS